MSNSTKLASPASSALIDSEEAVDRESGEHLVDGEADRPGSGLPARPSRWATFRKTVPTTIWVALLVETNFIIAAGATDGLNVARNGEVLRIALSYGAIIAMFGLIHLLVGHKRRLAVGVSFAALFAVVFMDVARQVSMGAFDWGFFCDYWREVFTVYGLGLFSTAMTRGGLVFLIVVPIVSAILLYKFPFEAAPLPPRQRWGGAAFCCAFLVWLPLGRVSTHESLTTFITSMVRTYSESRAAEGVFSATRYPYVHDFVPSEKARAVAGSAKARPHVVLLFMESWDGAAAEGKRADGRPYTPVFAARRDHGLSAAHFYGNSVHSSAGHFATLCSLPPMYRGTEMVELTAMHFHCLPEVMKDAGYRTLFVSGTDGPNFENGKGFLEKIGFSEVVFQDPARRAVDPNVWGMGLQDDKFYRSFFESLDARLAEPNGGPLFAVAASASNHYNFRADPHHVADPNEESSFRAHYIGSLTQSDAWLKVFLEELDRRPAMRDAIVILMGDHSFPADEHGVHFSMVGSYDEVFRTSFLLEWPGHVTPGRIEDRAVSQLDVAPTLTDLLQIPHKTHFVGTSIFADQESRAPVPMVQPYDGIHMVVVQYPFKLVRHESAEQEHLYDLSKDPDEEHDLIGTPAVTKVLATLRETMLRLRANQGLLREDRVWPPKP